MLPTVIIFFTDIVLFVGTGVAFVDSFMHCFIFVSHVIDNVYKKEADYPTVTMVTVMQHSSILR